jgi:hypothetical protein
MEGCSCKTPIIKRSEYNDRYCGICGHFLFDEVYYEEKNKNALEIANELNVLRQEEIKKYIPKKKKRK